MNGRHFFIQCTAKWRLWFHQESIFCQDVTNFLATSFYGKKLLNRHSGILSELIEVSRSFRDKRLKNLKLNVFAS